jgi:hypothetical protein
VTLMPPELATVHVLVVPDKFKDSLSAAMRQRRLLSFADNHRAHGWDDRTLASEPDHRPVQVAAL